MKNKLMLQDFERYCSVVSLLLIAGSGLIILQGPVGYLLAPPAPVPMPVPPVKMSYQGAPGQTVPMPVEVADSEGKTDSPLMDK